MIGSEKFRDPIHGYIEVRPYEKDIINSSAFQRLKCIKQLAFTYYVFHGAEHTRFGHSLGVMHIATKAFRSAVSKNTYLFSNDEQENRKRIQWLEQILRLIALTHDLGHAPFSHAAEDLFPVKQELTDGKKKYFKHEDLTEIIINDVEIANIINKIGAQFKSDLGEQYDITPTLICEVYSGKNPGQNSEFTFIKTFMDSELDCDKMDYLLRDSLFCGVTYGRYDIERLLSCLTIFKKESDESPYLGIESGGMQAFEEFVLARYFMFVQVYFHRTRRYFDLIFSNALREVLPNNCFPIDPQSYLIWDDIAVFTLLRERFNDNLNAKIIINRLPWTCVYETKTHPQGDGLTLFASVKKRLFKELGKENFLIDTTADKLPHKIVPRKHTIDDEEVIAIINDRTGKISTISDESQIICSLTEKINIQRIYANPAVSTQAKSIVSEF